MGRQFSKATLISVTAYGVSLLLGFAVDFRLTLFMLLTIQFTWTLFCVGRVVQLWIGGRGKADAPVEDRESWAFALGGSVSSVALLAVMVVVTQVV